MSRLSIEIPDHQRRHIEAMAASRGISVEDYILERVLPLDESDGMVEVRALSQLEAFLAPRIEAAERGEFSTLTMAQILDKARAQDVG